MHRLLWAATLLGIHVFSNALKLPSKIEQELDLIEQSAHPEQELDLLEKKKSQKKWNWKEASEESKTEWAIVLKRYVLADMVVFELGRFLGEALPGATAIGDRQESLGKAKLKLARLQSSLEKAVLDQNTSDATAGDMQKANKNNFLTVHEKRILAEEHKREQYGFFAVEASGQDVLQKAKDILQALEVDLTPQPKKAQPSWSSIVAAPSTPKPTYMSMLNATEAERNATSFAPTAANNKTSNHTATAKVENKPPTIAMLFKMFEDASKTFHGDLGNFETMEGKAMTNLLTIAAEVS